MAACSTVSSAAAGRVSMRRCACRRPRSYGWRCATASCNGMATVHVIGAGVAGLSCAVRLSDAGRRVRLYEAAAQGGGRCRSFFDATIERTIDNGNHMILAANTATFAYLDAIGAGDSLVGPPEAVFPFFNLSTGARWTLRPNGGRIPWWVASPGRRVPGTRIGQYLAVLRLARAGPDATVADCLDTEQPLFKRFFEPLAVAALNAAPREGSARLLWAVVAETFLRRLRDFETAGGRVRALNFGDARVDLGAEDAVVLAVP